MMVRRTKDGMIRFSSYSDVHRAMTMYTPDTISELAAKLRQGKHDAVATTLEVQDLYEEVLGISSLALSACYASEVLDSYPIDAPADELRDTLTNRVRWFARQSKAASYALDMAASLQAQRYNFTVPMAFNKAIVALHADHVSQHWKYVRLNNQQEFNGKKGKSYALCHVAHLTGIDCNITLRDNEDAPETYVRSDYNQVRQAEITAKTNKLIGLSCPLYNYDRDTDGRKPKLEAQEYSIFVTNPPMRGPLSPPDSFVAVGKLTNNKDLLSTLRQQSIQVN